MPLPSLFFLAAAIGRRANFTRFAVVSRSTAGRFPGGRSRCDRKETLPVGNSQPEHRRKTANSLSTLVGMREPRAERIG